MSEPDQTATDAIGALPKRRLTYPLAAQYVKDWTPLQALKELVANAVDSEADYRVTWQDGTLSIEDDGPGIPARGLLFGGTTKQARHIGQFGEGAKIALLVLARDPQVGTVAVDTVGYRFTAAMEVSDLLSVVSEGRTRDELLALTFEPSERAAGTRVTVDCPQSLAEALTAQVRYLSEPGYAPPSGSAEIVREGQPGRIWVGGMQVTHDPRLLASYDLPLSAKGFQNRDRTVVSTRALESHIRSALAHCTDPDTVSLFIEHALAGGDLSGPEAFFDQVSLFDVRHLYRAWSARRWPEERVYHHGRDQVQHETALSLQDNGWELVTSGLGTVQHLALMRLLGIGDPPMADWKRIVRGPRNETKWIRTYMLPDQSRRTLDLACGILESVYGRGCLGRVRVYESTQPDTFGQVNLSMYVPANDTIGIVHTELESVGGAVKLLWAAYGHRFAHRSPDYTTSSPRTREFEEALCDLATVALEKIATRELDPIPLTDRKVWSAGTPAGAYWMELADKARPDPAEPNPTAARRERALAQAPEPRRLLAELAEERMAAVLAEQPSTTVDQLMARLALQRRHFSILTHPHPAGYRRSAGVSTLPDYPKARVLGELLGIHPPVLYLAHIAPEGPTYRNPERKDRRWREPLFQGATDAVQDLRLLGGVYGEQADAVADMAAGRTLYDDQGAWLRPVTALVAAEAERLTGAEGDAAGPELTPDQGEHGSQENQ